jgi:antitoxin CptB
MSESRENRIKRLGYRAGRRGFKEADLLIGGFARARLPELGEAELDDFEALLDEPDPDLYAWVMGQTQPPARVRGNVLDQMRRFARDGAVAKADA